MQYAWNNLKHRPKAPLLTQKQGCYAHRHAELEFTDNRPSKEDKKTCWYGVHFSGSVEAFLPAQTITWNLDKEYHLQSSGWIERNKQDFDIALEKYLARTDLP